MIRSSNLFSFLTIVFNEKISCRWIWGWSSDSCCSLRCQIESLPSHDAKRVELCVWLFRVHSVLWVFVCCWITVHDVAYGWSATICSGQACCWEEESIDDQVISDLSDSSELVTGSRHQIASLWLFFEFEMLFSICLLVYPLRCWLSMSRTGAPASILASFRLKGVSITFTG